MQYILILVFVWDGQIELRHHQYAELMACNARVITFVQEAAKHRRPVLVAGCYPISKTWDIK